MIGKYPRQDRATTGWRVYKMPAGWKRAYEIDEAGSEAAKFGEEVAGPFYGTLGFTRAYEAMQQHGQKEAQQNEREKTTDAG